MVPIDPPTSKGHYFILIIMDYFSKWVEDIPLRKVKVHNIFSFYKNHIAYRFGVPYQITDNGFTLRSIKINNFNRCHDIDWHYSMIYYPKVNGLAKVFNKMLILILKWILEDNKW